MPFGSVNLTEKFEGKSTKDLMNEAKNFVYNELKDQNWIFNLDEEYEIIGAGDVFLSLGEVSRRAKKYPLQIEHNYSLLKEDVEKDEEGLQTMRNLARNMAKYLLKRDKVELESCYQTNFIH